MSYLGYGIVAYADILWTLASVFFIITLLLAPTFYVYTRGDAYSDMPRKFVAYEDTMLSNLGYSSVECKDAHISVGRLAIACDYGQIGKIVDFGVNNPDLGTPVDSCKTNEFN